MRHERVDMNRVSTLEFQAAAGLDGITQEVPSFMEFTGFTIDIDTGGTFTDGFMTADDRDELVKVDTTPHDLTVCFLNCI